MIGLYLLYYVHSNNEQDRIAQLDQNIARQQSRIGDLAPFRDLQARLNAKKPIADGIFRTRFAWDEFLRGLAFVTPDSTALDVFVGKATPINIQAQAGGGETQNLEPPGTITFNGIALPEYQNVSDFMLRMNNLRFLANAKLTRAELDRKTFSKDAIAFEVDADLVTKIGENGNEVLIGNESDNKGGESTDDGGASRGNQASRDGTER
jgi:Tfp pilus assembly protein PilN